MILRKIIFTIFLFPFCVFAQQDSTVLLNDSASAENLSSSSITRDDYLIDGTYMLLQDFQLRVITNLITQHETYNESMNRVDNETRNTNANLLLQGWFKVNSKVNIGINANLRAYRTGSNASSPWDVYSWKRGKTSKIIFRTITPVIKILLVDKNYKLSGQSTFIIPVSKAFDIAYKENILRDPNQAQWLNEIIYSKYYSKYFSLKVDLFSILRLGQTTGTSRFSLRLPVTPVFNYAFNPRLRINAFLELNPILYDGLFSTFYLKEGAGISYYISNTFTFDLLFTYIALGKRMPAQSITALGTRISF